MKLICQLTGVTSENHLWKAFPFTIISSKKKTEQIQPLIITQELGLKFSWYQDKVGSVAHHNPTMKWLFWGNTGSCRKGTTFFWYLYCMERRNSFRRFFLECKHIYCMVQFPYFSKANNKNFKFQSKTKHTMMLHKYLLKILKKEYHFDRKKIINYSYMWCVTLVPVRFCVFKVNNRNIRRPEIWSNLKTRIPEQYQLMLFWFWHC